jgi:acetyl esterase/lipase
MDVPVLFLVVSAVGLLFTLNALRPLPFEPTSIAAFFGGWLTSELPVHHFAWQAVATVAFVAAGALDGTAGWVGLGLTAVSWVGLAVLVHRGRQAEGVLEDVLTRGLGEGYRERIPAELSTADSGITRWQRLILPFRFRDPEVEAIKDVPYAPDGIKAHRLDVYRNRSRASGCPVFVYVHGGGWIIGDKREQGLPLMLHLAAHGWLCVTVNYRLSPKATFPDHLVDVKQAIAWVREHAHEYGGDPSFLVISGGSAGGHLCSLAALTPDDPSYQPGFEDADTSVDACVPIYGVYDFLNRDGLRGEGFTRFLLQRQVMKIPFASHREEYERASPMDRVHGEAPPFLVVHGANDSLVPVGEARRFVELLRAESSAPVLYAELPGAQHAFEVFRSLRTAHVVDAIARFLAVMYAERGGGHRPGAPRGTRRAPPSSSEAPAAGPGSRAPVLPRV